MKLNKGEVIYLARWYALPTDQVSKHIVSKDSPSDSNSVLAYSVALGHDVYVSKDEVYFYKKNAKRRVKLDAKLHYLSNSDIAEHLTDLVLKERQIK